MTVHPLVSVCIPTYNGVSYIQEALDSIKAQTYKNIEVIISDDQSSDGTRDILEAFCNQVAFPTYLYEHEPSGIGANWNHCLKNANGHYIKFLFQDDVLEPSCIEKMVAVLETNTNVGLVACKRTFLTEFNDTEDVSEWIRKYGNLQSAFEIQDEGTLLTKDFFKREDFCELPYNKVGEPPTTLFKASILKEIPLFDESLKQILDYVFYYRLLKVADIFILNESLVKFRLHPKQATNVNRGQAITDYQEYDAILYNEFYTLLHPNQQKRLWYIFSKRSRATRRFKKMIKRLLKIGS